MPPNLVNLRLRREGIHHLFKNEQNRESGTTLSPLQGVVFETDEGVLYVPQQSDGTRNSSLREPPHPNADLAIGCLEQAGSDDAKHGHEKLRVFKKFWRAILPHALGSQA